MIHRVQINKKSHTRQLRMQLFYQQVGKILIEVLYSSTYFLGSSPEALTHSCSA